MEKVDWENVQGLVRCGYGKLTRSAYLLLRFRPDQLQRKKKWLSGLAGRLTPSWPAPDSNTRPARNLALTASGLQHFGVEESTLNSFSFEFLEGMAPAPAPGTPIPRRTNILGDLGDSSPAHWAWGGWNEKTRDVDGLLMLFAVEGELDGLIKRELEAMDDILDGEPKVLRGQFFPDTDAPPGNDCRTTKEHFGFSDGISQPEIEGLPEKKKKDGNSSKKKSEVKLGSHVRPGEFVLGYKNERGARVTNGHGPDIRRNGTYLVFRQLEQDVPAFRNFVAKVADGLGETTDWVAARLLGRCKNGTPLVRELPNTNGKDTKNNFLYHYDDRSGLQCPIGAHIRRANPRDSFGPDPETALHLSKMHRIIRRGRPYGEQLNAANADDERGMLFIALNADIAGQFELIQHSWINNPHFSGLYTGTDPISHYSDGEAITIQSRPVNLRIDRPKPLVTVRGGAYFFLPGIQALHDIAGSA
jgi:Dyp-type peroxidase family